MRIRFGAICAVIFFTMTPLFAASPGNSVANFTLSNSSNIPGTTLPAGRYTIHVVNRLADRFIVQVDSASGDLHATFIGVPNSKLPKPSTPGMVNWSNSANGAEYLKGWCFPGTSSVVEFVYPKSDAVAIANSNQAKVLAIDPASEGLAADPTLSQRDMQLVTLWLLSAERVGPSDNTPSIKAERYQQVAGNSQKPILSALPHTASYLPWLWLLSAFSMFAAIVLHLLRTKQSVDTPAVVQKSNL
ncbi:MAG TPA: hypothetical protein VGU67_04655 [Edaphobacter sp.]|nr:hypothetical protein [Edaphobacter sp.]